MNHNVQAHIDAAAQQAEEQAKQVVSLAKMVQSGALPLDSLSTPKQDAVRQLLASATRSMTAQQFHAKQNAERQKFFRELKAQGFKVHRASQQDHDFIVDNILTTVDRGTKPAVKPMLREYAAQNGYEPEWAERVAAKNQPKKMARSLKAKKNHPVLQDLKEGNMLSQTHQAALKSATYSGLAELLFSGSQSTREKSEMRVRMAALESQMAVVRAEADRANARLNLMDAGLDWKEKARAILAAEPGISKRELARRVGQSEGSVRKYWSLLANHQECNAT